MQSGNKQLMQKQFQKNQNPDTYKSIVKTAVKDIQERVYWFNTSNETSFLSQFYDKQTDNNQVLKKRVAKITQDKLEQFLKELDQGKINNHIQLDVQPVEQNQIQINSLIPDIPHFDAKYFSPNHPKTKQAQSKLKKINGDLISYKAKTERLKKQKQQKRLEKQAQQEKMRNNLKSQRRQKFHQQVKRNLQIRKQKDKERKQQNIKFKQFLKSYKSSKPMHVLMEQEYHNKVQLPMLEDRKRKLQELSHKEKPSLQEINQHERSYFQYRQSCQQRIAIGNQTIDVPFKSKFYLQQRRKLLQGNEPMQSLFDQMEKKKRYSEIVKQNFKPRVSLKKKQDLQQSQHRSFSKQVPDRNIVIEKGKNYLQFMLSLKKKKQNSQPSQDHLLQKQKQRYHYANYLETMKHSRKNQSTLSHNWQNQLRNLTGTEYQRRQKVLLKSRKLQEKAFRQQQFVATQAYGKAQQFLEKKKQIDHSLVESIKAKVAILKEAKNG